jgi:hypothetical protein
MQSLDKGIAHVYHVPGTYEGDLVHDWLLVLKPIGDRFDLSDGSNGAGGTYEVRGDTLRLVTNYSYYGDKVTKIDHSEITIGSIPIEFKIRGRKLVEITEYDKYLPAYMEKGQRLYPDFKKIK